MTSEKETKPKLKRKFISLQQKIDILDQLSNGKKLTAIAKDLELNESSIRTVKQNESKIRSAVMSRSLQTLSKSSRVKDSLIPKTEKCLMIWIEDCHRNNIPVNSSLIKAKAQKIFTHLKELETVSSDEPKSKFVSSNGCFERFRKRFSLHSIQIQGERASADYESARNFKEELPKIIDEGEYTADQVYNADETGLYWKRMPKRTYLSENERSAGGLKASKERITLLVCSNASGDHITKPMLINRFLSPRAMKGIDKTTLPVHWRANENAWVTADIFHDWFYNCFVPEVENYSKTKNVSSKALLLIDDAPQHPVDLVHPNVKVLFLPANTTSILQPLDQGVMKTIKSHYIRRTLELISEKFECKPDMKLAEMWKDFSILKCVELICLSVRELKSSTLNACWKNVWPEVVLQENLLDSTSINIEPIVNIARSVGGEGFDDMNERDIYELINDAADLDEEELVQLADTSDANMTNSAEESSMQTVDEGDEQSFFRVSEGICHEDYVSGELELLSRHNDLKPLPSRESLKYICKKYYKELELLKGQIITAKSIKIDNTDSVSNRIDPQSFVTEKLAHINNVTTILENCNLTAFKTKRRYGYICFYCSRKFDKIELLADHQVEGRCKDGIKSIISKHPSDSLAVYVHVADMKCSICDKKLPNMNELKHHLMATHKKKIYTGYGDRIIPFELGKNKYDCQICGSSYETFGAVERHMNVHYRNYICDQCGVGFVTKNRLRVHIRSAHVTGSYPCDVCDKIFQAQHKYKNHVDVTHRMVKKNKCPKCPERFADYFHRHKHMVDAHGETPLRYKCNVCEALFKRRYALSCHTKRRHLDMRDVNCDVCPYKCYTITELKAHMIKHNGQRTYECNVCKKSYARKKTLKEHMRIHNNDRRYVCAVCGQGFVQNCSLKGHMKTHHTEYLNNLPR
nr:zinc finger and BTB domain-containing protein 11-like [Danaus plexippus plexippus]